MLMDLDTAFMRITGSVFVVLLHLSVQYTAAGIVYTSFSRFCVPLFFIISGYYLLAKEYSIRRLWQKALRLLGKMLLCSALYYLYDFACGKELPSLIYYLFTEPIHLWYLSAAAAIYVLTPVLYVFVEHASQKLYLYGLLISFVLGSVVTMAIRSGRLPILGILIENKMHLPYTFGFLFLFLLGGYFHKYPLSIVACRIFAWCFPLGALCTACLTFFRSRAIGGLDPFWLSFFSPFSLLAGAGSFTGIKSFFAKRQNLSSSKAWPAVLIELSSCTLGVYLFHPFFITWLSPYLSFPISPWVGIPLQTIAVYALTLLSVWIIKKCRLAFWQNDTL